MMCVRFSLLSVGVALSLLLMGCSGGSQVTPEEKQMSNLAVYFGKFTSRNKGLAPSNEKQLKDFILSQDDKADLDKLFTSPRDKEPVVVRYGLKATTPTTVMAHEKTGVGGKRYSAMAIGQVREVDEAEFKELVK
jgi:hypothetical protein